MHAQAAVAGQTIKVVVVYQRQPEACAGALERSAVAPPGLRARDSAERPAQVVSNSTAELLGNIGAGRLLAGPALSRGAHPDPFSASSRRSLPIAISSK